MSKTITVSPLPHTWLVDLDGCILSHNGHLNGRDTVLPGVVEFWQTIPNIDKIILLTSRMENHAAETQKTLKQAGLRYDQIIFSLPFGERILINDRKPSGLSTAHAINLIRDEGLIGLTTVIDPSI